MAVVEEVLTPEQELSLERDWKLFTALTFCFSFGFACYSGVFQNFLQHGYGNQPVLFGGLESIREVPGLLAALTAGTLVMLAEAHVAAIGLALTAIGIAATGILPSYTSLVMVTVLWSIGFHLYSTVSSAITLALAKGKEGGRHLGRMAGVGATATIVGLALCWGTSKLLPGLSYNVYFILGGISIFASAVLCWFLSAHAEGGERSRIILRREYSLYYLLIFLEGCRRQIFSIFASFALILVYHVPVQNMLLLQFVNSIMIAGTAPLIGRVIDRLGERKPLTFYSIGLIVVFLGYATSRTVEALYALYLIDNVLFSFGLGFTTYLNRIVRPGELTPCLAMGVTMNHVAAVTVPIGGALLWQHYHDYQLPFWVGVGIAAVSLIATRWLPTDRLTAKL